MECLEQDFLRAVDLLKKGELVAFPTETVYGLGASIFCEEAVKKIFLVKGRPSDNPLIAHVSSLEEVNQLALNIPETFFYRLAKAFWPGPLTVVLSRSSEVPALVSAGLPTIAIRMPAHPLALRLIRAVGAPLVAPSANLSGRPSPTNVEDVKEDLADRVPLILDGGRCSIGIESTVIHLAGPVPLLLRPGSITQEELESILQVPVLLAGKETFACSPGMRHRHYAPRASVKLFLDRHNLPESFPYLLSSEPIPSAIVFNRRNFYSCLREADRLGVKEIGIYCGASVQQDAGLMNRVLRCAGF